jgi:hypothetical protein
VLIAGLTWRKCLLSTMSNINITHLSTLSNDVNIMNLLLTNSAQLHLLLCLCPTYNHRCLHPHLWLALFILSTIVMPYIIWSFAIVVIIHHHLPHHHPIVVTLLCMSPLLNCSIQLQATPNMSCLFLVFCFILVCETKTKVGGKTRKREGQG